MTNRTYSGGVILVALVMLLLVPLLAYLQWRWIGQLSEGELERTQNNIRMAALHFSIDISNELMSAVRGFGVRSAESEEHLAADLLYQLDRWQARAAHPGIVGDIYLITPGKSGGASVVRRLSVAERRFVDTLLPADSTGLLSAFHGSHWLQTEAEPGQQAFFLRSLEGFALPLRPMHRPGETFAPFAGIPIDLDRIPRLVVTLRRDEICRRMLPDLALAYLQPAAAREYDFFIIRRNGTSPVFWATATDSSGLIPSAFDALMPLGIFPRIMRPGPPQGPGGSRLPEAPPPGEESPPADSLQLLHQPPLIDPGRGISERATIFELGIRYRGGSLEHAVLLNRYRNLAVSFGILVLLSSSVIILLIAAHRARSLALQQIEFVAGVSHELRTPLAVVNSVGANLAHGVVRAPKRVREYGRLVTQEVGRLSTIVDNALEYAGIHAHRRVYDMRDVAPAEMIKHALRDCEGILSQASMTVDQSVAENLPAIKADAQALQLVLKNIIVNGVKYGKSGGWLGVEVSSNGQSVSFRIADHGIGIESTDIPRIFDPFYRGHNATGSQIQGSGLGLSLAQHIVRAHGGSIEVRSTVGRGSTFTVQIPVAGDFR